MIAMVGGMVWVPRARLTKAKTITILVKEVIMAKRLGRRASAVKSMASLIGVDHSLFRVLSAVALFISPTTSEILGIVSIGLVVMAALPGRPLVGGCPCAANGTIKINIHQGLTIAIP
jgi:hypothetical protein